MKALLGRLKESFPGRLGKAYGEAKAGNYAAALAFQSFMSMFPLLLGILAIVGLVVRDPHRLAQVRNVIVNAFPSDSQGAIGGALQAVQQHSGLLGLISIVGLVWSGTNLFATMEFVLGEMFGVEQRSFLRQRLMGLVMMALFLVGVLAAVVANSVISAASSVRWLSVVGPLAGALVMIALVILIYRVVPNRTFQLSEVWRGALLAGILMEIITLAFPFYGKLVHGFNSYGATFALFFLLATWLFFLSQFIVLGAVANRMVIGVPKAGGAVAEPGERTTETRGSRAAEQQRRAS
jgi:membrane protein